MLLALVAVFMPFGWMNSIHNQIGLGDLPRVPIVGYLTRSASALYAFHGAVLVFLSGDVPRYRALVRFFAVAGMVFGAIMIGLDIDVGMPRLWTSAEGPFIMLFGGVVLWLLRQANAQGRNPPAT